ncbi:LysR family transcriptional regulator [Psychrobium sp. 1_MG-2023]|uniref:LysR family transcriptional regulator n=1 Tax=Psychrobium sp. 1_MG-2023 TaxID=3062624 RepID=UPI000C337EE8|nr:LysR family transcriptional regulator [Psychrobium sp. 1_MG-2023]MDP2562811.1 LysR family transcriptional regulator [Psychrobium sp. 1_MG-2023]PKF54440.1 LysR family transcriptional regulator [Alteromonadales bacterium alter-6D02]
MYSQLPPLNSLKVFDSAARLGSFKEAASELHVTPTAVSHQIKALETFLDTPLFERKTRAIELTTEGQLLAQTTYSVLQQLANTINEITVKDSRMTISTTSSFAAMWLVPNLSKFNHIQPHSEVVIQTSELLEDIDKNKRIDLAIRYGHYDKSVKNSTLLITEDIGMYAAPSYIRSLNSFAAANLLETSWHNEQLEKISWHSLLSAKGLDYERTQVKQFNQEHHIIQAALAGQGIALVSSLLVQNAVEQGWLVKCHEKFNELKTLQPITGFSYYLLTPQHNLQSDDAIIFKRWLLDELKAID